jgi:hypothetical protein
MKHHSHINGFYVERCVTDLLWDRARDGANELFSRLFLAAAGPLLQTHFQTHETKNDRAINIINFDLHATPELHELRQPIWRRIFTLYPAPVYRESVLELLDKHTGSGYLVADSEIVARDAAEVQPFFRSALDPSEYGHCVIVQDYLEMLDRLEVEADEELRDRFTNEVYALSELLYVDRRERRDLGREEYERLKRERLDSHTAAFGVEDYDQFFERCVEILRTSGGMQDEYQIHNSVREVLFHLAGRDGALYEAVLDRYLHSGNALKLGPWGLVLRLIQVSGPDRAYEILSEGDYPQKSSWLFGYFMALPPEAVTAEHLRQLYALYETAARRELLRDMDFLLKFMALDDAVVIRVTRTLVERARVDSGFGHALGDMFDHNSEIGRRLRELFAGEVALLKSAYLAASEADTHNDYDGRAFDQILDLDSGFAGEWVTWMLGRKEWSSRYDDTRNYSFIWQRADHGEVMERIIDAIHSMGSRRVLFGSYLNSFFVLTDGTADIQTLHERQDAFLDDFIARRHSDIDLTLMVFDVVGNFAPKRRRGRIETFLRHNEDLEVFERLPLIPNWESWSGSRVPVLQRRVDYLESLLPLLHSVELLGHKQHVEHMIQWLRDDIEREKRRDFIGH